VRQTRADRFLTELYVVPNSPDLNPQVMSALQARVTALQAQCPGVTLEDRGAEIHLGIPAALRTDHEAHFAQVATHFLQYLRHRETLPAWERPNMLAKYYVTTKGTHLSRQPPARPPPRLAPR